MNYYLFYDKNLEQFNGAGQCECLNDEIENVAVTEAQFNKFVNEPYAYVYSEGKAIVNPNYEADKQKALNKAEAEEIKMQLNDLDLKSIRAIRANDQEYIERYETEAAELRQRLRELEL